jgi:oxalate decarboxylase/phosphoglucose isomerase-like protein (cupin superfamily)
MTDPANYFIRPDKVERFGFDWGQLTLTVGPGVNSAERFSGGLVDVAPGGGHARHNHPGAEEIILVIDGTGEQMVEDEHGNPVTQKVGPGCTIYIPESRFHATLNTGPGPMKLFVVYSPAGPEQALRELPDFTLLPPSGTG